MKKNLFAGKSTRTKIFTVITIISIVLLLLLNLFVNSFGIFGVAFIDMTPEGLYTLRPAMIEACRDIFLNEDGTPKEQGIKMTFCDDPDNLISDTITRVVYYMAVALSKEYSNFEVETVNVGLNPTAVSMYKNTSLTEISSDDVIVSYGARYRVLSAESFWRISNEELYSYDGEYKLASVMMSLTLVNRPVAYFVTDHGEDYYDYSHPESEMSKNLGGFIDLLTERGLEIKTISLSETLAAAKADGTTPDIPEDCVLLIINNPKTDFVTLPDEYDSFGYISETELVDRYLTRGKGSVMVAKDYRIALPVFEDFLAEWGMDMSETLVKDVDNAITDGKEQGVTLVGGYNTEEDSYAYSIYGDYAGLSTAPRTVITETGRIDCSYGDSPSVNESGTANTIKTFTPFIYTSDGAMDYAKNELTGEYVDRASDAEQMTVAAISTRHSLDSVTTETTYSYLFCAASAKFFSSELLGNTSYANYEITSSLVQSIARLDTYASMELGGISANNYTGFGGKQMVVTELSESDNPIYKYNEDGTTTFIGTNYAVTVTSKVIITVVAFLVPLSVAVVGIIVCIRRKFL